MQVAAYEVSRVPAWLSELHCPDLSLSCHFNSSAGFLMFCHNEQLPEPILQVQSCCCLHGLVPLSNVRYSRHHVVLRCSGLSNVCSANLLQPSCTHRQNLVVLIVKMQSVFSDYTLWSHEGYFYQCASTQKLYQEVGDLEMQIAELEVCRLHLSATSNHVDTERQA
jgi:hypothetical protein